MIELHTGLDRGLYMDLPPTKQKGFSDFILDLGDFIMESKSRILYVNKNKVYNEDYMYFASIIHMALECKESKTTLVVYDLGNSILLSLRPLLMKALTHIGVDVKATTACPIILRYANSIYVDGVHLSGSNADKVKYGDLLTAIDTGVFGRSKDIHRSEESGRLLEELALLNRMCFQKLANEANIERRNYLKLILE